MIDYDKEDTCSAGDRLVNSSLAESMATNDQLWFDSMACRFQNSNSWGHKPTSSFNQVCNKVDGHCAVLLIRVLGALVQPGQKLRPALVLGSDASNGSNDI